MAGGIDASYSNMSFYGNISFVSNAGGYGGMFVVLAKQHQMNVSRYMNRTLSTPMIILFKGLSFIRSISYIHI